MTGGQAHQGLPSFVNFDRPPATTLPPVEEPTLLFFDGLTAHEVRQDAVELTDEQRCGASEVPHDCTRTAEYPIFSSEILHGSPHQSRAEVATAYATGVPPDRWAHVWTGNRQDATAASYLEPLVAPAPVGPNTLPVGLTTSSNKHSVRVNVHTVHTAAATSHAHTMHAPRAQPTQRSFYLSRWETSPCNGNAGRSASGRTRPTRGWIRPAAGSPRAKRKNPTTGSTSVPSATATQGACRRCAL